MARTVAEQLVVLRTQRDTLQDQLTTHLASPLKPNYGVGGQNAAWTDFYRMLVEQIAAVNAQINRLSWEGGPVTSFHRP